MEPLRNFHVNWVDGMKINKDHFIAMENVHSDHLMDAIAMNLNDRNFGLLPPLPGKNTSLKMELSKDMEKHLRIRIQECRAITQGGARIEILEESPDMEGVSIPIPDTDVDMNSSDESIYYILLSVQPHSRIPVGNADPGEDPPRHPYTMPEIKVHVIPEKQRTQKEMGFHTVTIGKIKMVEGQPEIIKEYIPPCHSIQSHVLLKELHTKYEESFSQLEMNLVKILKKIREKEQSSELSNTVSILSTNMLYFISTGILPFRWTVSFQPPVAMFEFVASCARLIRNTIEARSGKSKEELLNYLTDWCELNQGEFDNILSTTVNFNYQHTRILETANMMNQFIELISNLFDKLSSLEYVGKKKDTGIFVKEQKGSKSFLAE